jgi:uncharacterized phage-associated protein
LKYAQVIHSFIYRILLTLGGASACKQEVGMGGGQVKNCALSVANAFIERANREGVPISNMKLQKLMYFAHGHNLGLRGMPLVDEAPEAWEYGPVFPSIYHTFKAYGSQPILAPGMLIEWESGRLVQVPAPPIDDPMDQQMIDAVWNGYKDRTPIQLSNMSHVDGGPWQKAREKGYRNADISDEVLMDYFRPKISIS